MSTPEHTVALALANAHHFTCTILKDRRYLTARFRTLEEANAYCPKLEAIAANGRLAMIYAVGHDGLTTFIPQYASDQREGG